MTKTLVPISTDDAATLSGLQKNSRTSVESYRLWFEYLRRATTRKELKVNRGYYKTWDLREKETFMYWWERIGQQVTLDRKRIPALIVSSDNANLIKQNTHINIAIPNNITATEAGELVRKLLLKNNHSRKIQVKYPEIRSGAEIRHLSLRSYLVCYDCYQFLLHHSDNSNAIELLKFVRRVYHKQYKLGKIIKDPLPSTLCGIGENPKNFEHVCRADDAQALNTVKRYVTKADQIIRSVAEGHFPD